MIKQTAKVPLFRRGGPFFTLPGNLLSPALFLPLLAVLLVAAPCRAARITDYRVLRQPVTDAAGRVRIAIREFRSDGEPHLLVVDPETLQSFDIPAHSVRFTANPAGTSLRFSRYLRAVQKYTAAPYRLQNGGAVHAESAVDGVFLTVDLCPSRRPFERAMFDSAGALAKGAPVAVSVSGLWLVRHPEELSYLKSEVAAGRLAITWVNHSYHHTYEPKAPLAQNFVLTPGTDFSKEVLELEQQLLADGLVPSPFFRFPGLVSDRATMLRLRELSLIPIGSDAWLAKGETPRSGSFILVHGNGNEPKGVRLLLPMLKGKGLHLLPLRAAFGG
jgi:hypothetical protein